MNLAQRLLSGTVGRRSHPVEGPYPLTSSRLLELLTLPSKAGVAVTPKSVLGITAYFRGTVLIAGDSAGLPLHAYRTNTDGSRTDTTRGHPVLVDPHPEMTPYEFWELIYGHLCLWGNAYAVKIRGENNRVIALEPLLPSRVRVGRSGGVKVFAVQTEAGPEVPFLSDEILHIPGFGYDGVLGLNPIEVARNALGLAIAVEEYGSALFANGALFSGVLQTDRRLDKTQADALKARWQEMTSGLTNAHQTAILDSGAKFQPLSMSPEDAQFLDTRRFSVVEVARLLGVPPHMLMETDKSTSWGSGLEEQHMGYLTHTLAFYLNRVAARVTKELLPRGQYAEHITEGLLKSDTAKRFEAYGTAIDKGWMNRAEVRRKENLPDGPSDLAEFLVPQNMTTATKLAEAEAAPAEGNQEPEGPSVPERINAAGTLVRSGFDPEDSLEKLDLPPIKHLGLLPVTLQKAEKIEADAAIAEGEADQAGEPEPADEDEPADDAPPVADAE